MTCFLVRDCNLLPKREIHRSLQVEMVHENGEGAQSQANSREPLALTALKHSSPDDQNTDCRTPQHTDTQVRTCQNQTGACIYHISACWSLSKTMELCAYKIYEPTSRLSCSKATCTDVVNAWAVVREPYIRTLGSIFGLNISEAPSPLCR